MRPELAAALLALLEDPRHAGLLVLADEPPALPDLRGFADAVQERSTALAGLQDQLAAARPRVVRRRAPRGESITAMMVRLGACGYVDKSVDNS